MTHGLRVVGDRGSIQVDELYSNLQLVSKVTARFPSGGPVFQEYLGTSFIKRIAVEAWGIQPIAFYRCGNWASCEYATPVHGNPNLWQFHFMTPATDGPVIEVWIFDRAEMVVGPGSHGLIVRGAAGQVVFDSRNVSLRLTDVLTFDANNQSGGNFVYPNRTYALAHGRLRSTVTFSHRAPSQLGANLWMDAYQDFLVPTSTGFANQSFRVHENGAFSSSPGRNTHQPITDVMLADVTGL